jgi:hypothetical protein
MATAPPDTGKYLDRLDALGAYVQARDTETARPGAETTAAADAAYERYAALRQDGPAGGSNSELEAGS